VESPAEEVPAEKIGARYNLPMPPDPISEAVRLAKADIADFEARMREVTPAYQRGDRVELCRNRCQGLVGGGLRKPFQAVETPSGLNTAAASCRDGAPRQ
jgi:hypothetical protein